MVLRFLGATDPSRSLADNSEQTINWYPELRESQYPLSDDSDGHEIILVPTPGLKLFCNIASSGVFRALYVTALERAFAVIGSALYEVFSDGTSTMHGRIKTFSGNVSISENETQLIILDGQDGWIFTLGTNALDQIINVQDSVETVGFTASNQGSGYKVGDVLTLTTPSGGSACIVTVDSVLDNEAETGKVVTAIVTTKGRGYATGEYATTGGSGTGAIATVETLVDGGFESGSHVVTIDGFFLKTKINSGEFQWSYLRDGKTWDALAYFTAEGSPDNLVSVGKVNNEIFLFGTRTTEIWYDTGNPDSQFQRINQGFLDIGCSAEWSVATQGNRIFWLGGSANGQGIVWTATGYVPQRISTHAIEYQIAQIAKEFGISDAEGNCYQQEGHFFYVLTFPLANKTYCYDLKTGLWHERLYWNKVKGEYERHRAKWFTFWNGKNYVCDHANSNIYELDLDTYTDNGDEIRRMRTGPHIRSDRKLMFFYGFELDIERGTGGEEPIDYVLIRYKGNGNTSGSAPVDNTHYDVGDSVLILNNQYNLVKTGYTFDGWNTKTDGSGTDVAVGSYYTLNANTSLYAKWELEEVPIAWWKGEQNLVDSIAGRDGTAGAGSILYVPGVVGDAFSFNVPGNVDLSNYGFSVAHDPVFDFGPTDTFRLDFYMKLSNVNHTWLISKGDWGIGISPYIDDSPRIVVKGGGGISFDPFILTREFQHIAVVYSNGTWTISVDDIVVGSHYSPITHNTSPLLMANTWGDSEHPFTGAMDEIKIFGTAHPASVVGNSNYLFDELGNYLFDENGNYLFD